MLIFQSLNNKQISGTKSHSIIQVLLWQSSVPQSKYGGLWSSVACCVYERIDDQSMLQSPMEKKHTTFDHGTSHLHQH